MGHIDLVYCWVNGNDPSHQNLRNQYLKSPSADSTGEARFRSNGEIYASIRSAYRFLPWLRHIFVVVDDIQLSAFDQSKVDKPVKIIPHSKIFTKFPHHLPTFNSQAIESHLHEIPGLSELFIYANDDMFFGHDCRPSHFFSNNDPKLFFSKWPMPSRLPGGDKMHICALANNSQVLNSLVGKEVERMSLVHQVKAVSKALFKEAWNNKKLRSLLESTSASRFRQRDNVEPVGLIQHWAYQNNKAIAGKDVRSRYWGIRDDTDFDRLHFELLKGRYHLYCLNDTMTLPSSKHVSRFATLLHQHLPHLSQQSTDPVYRLLIPPRPKKSKPRPKPEVIQSIYPIINSVRKRKPVKIDRRRIQKSVANAVKSLFQLLQPVKK